MGKPLKKEREHKNKSKIGDIIFEKIEANGFVDFDENCAPRVTMNKHLNSNFTPSLCEWINSEEFKQNIVSYVNEKVQTWNIDFSKIVEMGIEMGWNFKKMNEKMESLSINEIESATSTEEDKEVMIPSSPIKMIIKDCQICGENRQEFFRFECGHVFCLQCTKEYLKTLLNENGPAIVTKTCPMEGCKAILSFTAYEQAFGKDSSENVKYNLFLQNFLLATKESKIHQCPFQNCPYIFKVIKMNLVKSVTCPLGHSFCCKCFKVPHPIVFSCKDLVSLNTSTSAFDMCWIVSNTKKCPRCKSSIEKNNGCNHMTCRNCTHQFCWMCFSNWRGHATDDQMCKAMALRIAQQKEVDREKAENRCIFMKKLTTIFEKYTVKMKEIEETKKIAMENFEKKCLNTQVGIKIKKAARNFGCMIFEMEKNLAFIKEAILMMENKNVNNISMQAFKNFENSLMFFSNAVRINNLHQGLLSYYMKNYNNSFAIQKFTQLKSSHNKIKNVLFNY